MAEIGCSITPTSVLVSERTKTKENQGIQAIFYLCQNGVKDTERRKMDKNTRSRKYQLMFNNPHKFKDCSHEGIK